MAHEGEQCRKVFIGGLSYKTTEEGLRGFYSQWGELLDAVVMTDKATGNSRGFGFVTYSEVVMVDDAMANRPHTIDGRTVQPKRAVPRELSGDPGANVTVNKIFIGGIRDKPVTKEDLEAYFGTFGTIKDCVIMLDKETRQPRGFAFVEFDDYDPVDQIILKGYHHVNGVKIDVKKALPKDGASGEAPRGGNRRGGAAPQRGGRGGRGGGRGGRGSGSEGRGRGGGGGRGGARSLMGSEYYGGGGQGSGYANENHYAGNGWNQGADQGMGWSPSMANNAHVDHGQGYNQEYSTSYPIYGQQPLQQQQPQPQQPNYEGFGPDFGQNYAQGQGGGAVKGGGFGGPAGRPAPYANQNYGR